jgi:hypothetical protein
MPLPLYLLFWQRVWSSLQRHHRVYLNIGIKLYGGLVQGLKGTEGSDYRGWSPCCSIFCNSITWRQEETNVFRRIIRQSPMAKRSKIDIRSSKKGRSQNSHGKCFL